MDIDQRDIEKGSLPEILPKFYPNSISYLSELNEYRMYAEMWSNRRSKERFKRSEIGREGYLKTLEMGEVKKKRKVDKVRFDYFVAANSVNYMVKRDLYGKPNVYIQMGGVQTNSILNEIIKVNKHLFEIQSQGQNSAFHSEDHLPKAFNIDLAELNLQQDEEANKYYFEIPTNSNEISNPYQKILLSWILGKDAFCEKLLLLHKVDRKCIKCLFENPEFFKKSTSTSKAIPRLCVAWPFYETIVFDFAGTLEYYKETCLLGTLIGAKEKQIEKKAEENQTESAEGLKAPRIDGYA